MRILSVVKHTVGAGFFATSMLGMASFSDATVKLKMRSAWNSGRASGL